MKQLTEKEGGGTMKIGDMVQVKGKPGRWGKILRVRKGVNKNGFPYHFITVDFGSGEETYGRRQLEYSKRKD